MCKIKRRLKMAIKNKDGSWLDGKGDFIPTRYIPILDKKKDKIVEKLTNKAMKPSKELAKSKLF